MNGQPYSLSSNGCPLTTIILLVISIIVIFFYKNIHKNTIISNLLMRLLFAMVNVNTNWFKYFSTKVTYNFSRFNPYRGALCKTIWVCIFLDFFLVFWKYSSICFLHIFFLCHVEIIMETHKNSYEQYIDQYWWMIMFDGIKWYMNMSIYNLFCWSFWTWLDISIKLISAFMMYGVTKQKILAHSWTTVISSTTYGHVAFIRFALVSCYLFLRKKGTVGT